MLAAKLFAALALVFAIIEGLARVGAFPAVSVPLQSTYYVFGPELVLLLTLVTSANFAVLYYSGERIFRGHWNRRLTFLHFGLFVCFAISLLIASALSAREGVGVTRDESMRWLVVCMLLGILSLVASLAVFGINLTLTVVQLVRARFARH
jgi:hypothetical protein